MTSRDHLLPSAVVDRNGKTTTVYKRPVLGPERTPKIPMVNSAVQKPKREETIFGLINHVLTGGTPTRDQWLKLESTLSGYPDDLLERLDTARRDGDPMMAMMKSNILADELPNVVSEEMYFLGELKLDIQAHMGAYLVQSLHEYDELPHSDDFSKESDELRAHCLALMNVAFACDNIAGQTVIDYERSIYCISDKKLIGLVMEHPDKGRFIADFITTRGDINVDMIAEAIAGDHGALTNGAL